MKVFTCTSFTGHWPVGTAAVIVAKDKEEARAALAVELMERGLKVDDAATWEIKRLKTTVPSVTILRDGEY